MNEKEQFPGSTVALDKVFELAGRLADMMRGTLADRGLTPGRAEALLVLHQGGPMLQRAMSEALACTPRHVTALVDVLEDQGWAARRPHPTDRRATLVALTERGMAAAEQLATERERAAGLLFGDVPTEDLATFLRIADQVLDRLSPLADGAP